MNVGGLLALVFVVMAVALVATLMVGFSKSNREENPDYMKRTGRNWAKLGMLYVICILAVALVFIILWGS